MAIAIKTPTKLCLSTFADYMGIHPLAFAGIDISTCIEGVIPCSTWMQNIWQNSTFISRESLAKYIYEAEQQIESYLNMYVAPTFTCGELHEWPKYYKTNKKTNCFDVKFVTNWKNVIAFGQERLQLVDEIDLVYTDEDGDTFYEFVTGTLTLPEFVTDINKLYLTYPNKNGCKEWKICPFQIVSYNIETRVLVFTLNSWNLLNESSINITTFGDNIRYANGCDLDNFLETVELWYQDIDPCKAQVELVYTDNDLCRAANCTELVYPACVNILDKCEGIFTIVPMQYDDDGCVIAGNNCPMVAPDFIRIFYLSGCTNTCANVNCSYENGVCDNLTAVVAKLAASKLPQQLCTCKCFEQEIQRLQVETSISYPNGPRYSYPFEIRNNPFGTTIGAIEVFQLLELYFANRSC